MQCIVLVSDAFKWICSLRHFYFPGGTLVWSQRQTRKKNGSNGDAAVYVTHRYILIYCYHGAVTLARLYSHHELFCKHVFTNPSILVKLLLSSFIRVIVVVNISQEMVVVVALVALRWNKHHSSGYGILTCKLLLSATMFTVDQSYSVLAEQWYYHAVLVLVNGKGNWNIFFQLCELYWKNPFLCDFLPILSIRIWASFCLIRHHKCK